MKVHINRLYSMYPEQIEKLVSIATHYGSNKSAIIRRLIDEEYGRIEKELPTTSTESNSDASN